jgi:ATP-dependent RNA helicase RhlE
MSFSNLGLSKSLVKEIENQNYTTPTPIQAEAIPAIIDRKDVLGIAKTGSGKTASFVLPILMNLQGAETASNRHINVLVLVPTRELAIQVNEVFTSFASVMPNSPKTLAVFGGVSINTQMQELQNVNVLVATPGRLLDLTDANAVKLSSVEVLVLDEADKMLNLGFKAEMEEIYSLLPKKRQNVLFSATLNKNISNIKNIILNVPVVIKVKDENEGKELDQIKQLAYLVDEDDKGPLLRHLIKTKKLKQVLVFASSLYKADNIADKLRKNGIDAQAIHRKKSQAARTSALKIFKEGQLKVLVATDILSRGIDINELPCVVNYELPRSPKDYIHRIGRTGRADAKGEAISLISPEDEQHFKVIQKKMGKWVNLIDSKNIEY